MGVSPPGVGLHCPVVMATKLYFALLDFGEQQRRIPPPRVVASSVPRSHRRVSISPLRIISGKTFSPSEGEGSPSARLSLSSRRGECQDDIGNCRLCSPHPTHLVCSSSHRRTLGLRSATKRTSDRRGRSFFKLRVRPAEFSAQAGSDSPIEASGRGRSELRAPSRERETERTDSFAPAAQCAVVCHQREGHQLGRCAQFQPGEGRRDRGEPQSDSCSTSRIRRGAPAVTGNCKCGRRRGQELRPPPEGQEQVLPEQKEVWAAGVGAGGA